LSRKICKLLALEFLFVPPLGNLEYEIQRRLADFESRGIIEAFVEGDTKWDACSPASDPFVLYKMNELNANSIAYLEFLSSALRPWLAAYQRIISLALLTLKSRKLTEPQLVSEIFGNSGFLSGEKACREIAEFGEAFHVESIRNALKTMMGQGILAINVTPSGQFFVELCISKMVLEVPKNLVEFLHWFDIQT